MVRGVSVSLELTLQKAKGLPLIIMIRWCPLPFAINNGLFAVRLICQWHELTGSQSTRCRYRNSSSPHCEFAIGDELTKVFTCPNYSSSFLLALA